MGGGGLIINTINNNNGDNTDGEGKEEGGYYSDDEDQTTRMVTFTMNAITAIFKIIPQQLFYVLIFIFRLTFVQRPEYQNCKGSCGGQGPCMVLNNNNLEWTTDRK